MMSFLSIHILPRNLPGPFYGLPCYQGHEYGGLGVLIIYTGDWEEPIRTRIVAVIHVKVF